MKQSWHQRLGAVGRMKKQEESCHSWASDSFSHGRRLNNRWPIALAYAEMCYMSPQKKCKGSGLSGTEMWNSVCGYRPR